MPKIRGSVELTLIGGDPSSPGSRSGGCESSLDTALVAYPAYARIIPGCPQRSLSFRPGMGRRRANSTLALLALCAVILAIAAAPASAGTKAIGIDVSRFQGVINWPLVAGSGIKFAFVQASRGSGSDCAVKPDDCGADPYFAANRINAKTVGIRIGPYHRAFATGATLALAKADAAAEADVFIAQVGALNAGELLPVLDVETPFTGLTAKRLRTWIRVWLKRVKNRLGTKPMIYTNASSWGATGDTTEFARAKYPLWVAEWGVSKPSVPANFWAGRGWSVWQYTSSGSVNGISGRVDMDRLRIGLGKLTVD
jgi:lysozyme